MIFHFLFYGCRMRTLYCRHIKKLEKFHKWDVCYILGIMLQDGITDLEILNCVNSISIESILIKSDVICMEMHHNLRWMLYRERYYIAKDIKADQRNGPKTQLKLTSLGTKSDQSSWRSVLLTGCIGRPLPIKTLHTLKKPGILNSFPKKNNATVALHINTNIQCPHCSRLCMHKLGLQNHGWIAKQSLLWTQ